MNEESIRRAGWTYITGLAYAATTQAVGLMLTPILLRLLGPQRFGGTRAMTDLYGWLGVLELGLGGALAPLLVRSLAQGEDEALRRLISAGVRVYFALGLVILVVGGALTPLLPSLAQVNQPAIRRELALGWLIGLASYATFALTPFRWLVAAGQRGYQINLLLIAQSLLTTFLAVGLVYAGTGLIGQGAAQAVGATFGALGLAALAVWRRSDLARAPIRSRPDLATLRDIWRLGLPTAVVTLLARISFVTDSLIVGAFFGLETVGNLYLTQRLAVLAQAQVQAVGVATWAALADMHARGEHEAYRRRVVELSALVTLLGLAALGPIVAYSHHFVDLWVGAERYVGDGVVLTAAVNGLLMGLLSLWIYCFNSTGQIGRLVPGVAASTAVNIVASLVLTPRLGPIGPLLGTTVGFVAVYAWYIPLQLRRQFGIEPATLLGRAVGRPLALGVPCMALLWYAARFHKPMGWIGLAIEMGASATLFLLLGARILLGAEQRTILANRILGRFRPARPARGEVEVAPEPEVLIAAPDDDTDAVADAVGGR